MRSVCSIFFSSLFVSNWKINENYKYKWIINSDSTCLCVRVELKTKCCLVRFSNGIDERSTYMFCVDLRRGSGISFSTFFFFSCLFFVLASSPEFCCCSLLPLLLCCLSSLLQSTKVLPAHTHTHSHSHSHTLRPYKVQYTVYING